VTLRINTRRCGPKSPQSRVLWRRNGTPAGQGPRKYTHAPRFGGGYNRSVLHQGRHFPRRARLRPRPRAAGDGKSSTFRRPTHRCVAPKGACESSRQMLSATSASHTVPGPVEFSPRGRPTGRQGRARVSVASTVRPYEPATMSSGNLARQNCVGCTTSGLRGSHRQRASADFPSPPLSFSPLARSSPWALHWYFLSPARGNRRTPVKPRENPNRGPQCPRRLFSPDVDEPKSLQEVHHHRELHAPPRCPRFWPRIAAPCGGQCAQHLWARSSTWENFYPAPPTKNRGV